MYEISEREGDNFTDLSGEIDPVKEEPFGNKSFMSIPVNFTVPHPAAHEWLQQKRENVRPWREFVNTNQLRLPKVSEASQRVMTNLKHFQSNYIIVAFALLIYCIVSTPLLLVAMGGVGGTCYYLQRRAVNHKLILFGREVPLTQQFIMVALASIPVLLWAGAGSAVFWILGASLFFVILHALFRKPVINPDETFELEMEPV